MTIAEMQKRLDELNTKACEAQALADTEKRDLTEEEKDSLQQTLDDFENLEEQKKQRERLEAQTRRLKNLGEDPEDPPSTRRTEPVEPGRRAGDPLVGQREPTNRVVHERWRDDPNLGWRSTGEFLQAVHHASAHGAQPDVRLTRAALATFGQEATGGEGGFAAPPAHLDRIMTAIGGESLLMPLVDDLTIERNSITIPKDETTPWGTAGAQGSWIGEGTAIPQSKPSLKSNTLKLHKLASLVPLTEELLEDATALETYMFKRVSTVFGHLVDLAFFNGSGSGQPQGMLGAASVVSIAKESGQSADTILGLNVLKMWSRLFAPWRTNAIWLANQDTEPEFSQMYVVDKESTPVSSWPVYLPAGGFSGQQFATLFGRPVHFTQICETLGDKGDIMVIDPKQFLMIKKTGGMKSTTSIHFWFDQDAVAFKTIMRLAGQPWWDSTIAARDGTTTYSAFVTLDERT